MAANTAKSSTELPQQCPICGAGLAQDQRYPSKLCRKCVNEATDERGRKLEFSNVDATGGFVAVYAETGEPYPDHVCYVRGIQCCADEAHLGGIVVQPIKSPASGIRAPFSDA
jgi:hypothetical protein